MPNRDIVKHVAAAAFVLSAAVFFARPAHAQLPGGGAPAVITVPGSVESDQPVETSTNDIDTVQLPPIVISVTTGGGGGDYQPNSQFIASLDSALFSGINSQNFNTWFPGWQALPPNSTDTVAIPLATTVLTTYGQALALAQSQEQELEGENFSNIEQTSAQTNNLLTAVQANTEAQLANVQEQEYLRQLVATLITVETTKAAEEFNEKAQQEATDAMSFNGGITP
jgi:hypothetical protein